jgi:protein gp37
MAGNHILATSARKAYAGGEPWMNTDELSAPLRRKKPAVIGVQFMGDLFHQGISNDWIAAIYGVMASTPHHLYFMLTKRPERRLEFETWISCASKRSELSTKVFAKAEARKYTTRMPLDSGRNMYEWPIPNVVEGVSVEDQDSANERIPMLLDTSAAKRWVSYEPALGSLELRISEWGDCFHEGRYGKDNYTDHSQCSCHLDLLVAGAETGPGARPCNPDWLRSVRDQCAAAKVPFFLKQVDAAGERELDGRMHEELCDEV